MTTPYAAPTTEKPKVKLPQPRKGEGEMDAEELQSILHSLITESVSYVDSELSPARQAAHKYFKAEPFGNEEPGRSQVVMPEVMSAVSGMMPELVRIFTGPKHYAEFAPTRPNTTENAKQATDFVRLVIEKDNPGFQIIHDSLWDGLVKRTGIVKWGWDEYCEEFYALRNVTQEQLDALQTDESATISSVKPEDEKVLRIPTDEEIGAWQEQAQALAQQGQQPPPPPQPEMVDAFSIEVVYKTPKGKPWVCAVPPEELLVLRSARTTQQSLYVGHRTEMTTGELIAMGVEPLFIETYGGRSPTLAMNGEQTTRQPNDTVVLENPPAGEANDVHDVIENYVLLDFNGDGIQELRCILTLGPGYEPIPGWNKIIAEVPMAIWSPYPEPHAIIGRSVADRTMDLQKINSMLVRSGLDSLAASIFPRTAYQDGIVSAADIQNTEIGASIRVKGDPNAAIKSFTHNFNGKEIFAFLDYFRQEKTQRTGIDNGAAGLDMDALQSTAPDAANEVISSNKMQIELIARIYAEQIMKPLFRGLLKLLIANQPTERLVQLRGKFVPIDPRVWDSDMDVTVNVAVGRLEDRKRALLMGIIQKQELILTTLGSGNPLVHLSQYYNAMEDLLALDGILDTARYFSAVDPNWQPPQQAAQESPEQIIARAQTEIDRMKTLAELAMKEEEIKQKREADVRKFAFEQQKLAADIELRKYEIMSRWHAQINDAQLTAEVERQRMLIERHTEGLKAAAGLVADLHSTEAGTDAAMHASQLDADMRQKEIESAAEDRGEGGVEE